MFPGQFLIEFSKNNDLLKRFQKPYSNHFNFESKFKMSVRISVVVIKAIYCSYIKWILAGWLVRSSEGLLQKAYIGKRVILLMRPSFVARSWESVFKIDNGHLYSRVARCTFCTEPCLANIMPRAQPYLNAFTYTLY